jgi:hypothetical protein
MIMQQCLIAVIILLMSIIVELLIMTIAATDHGELGLVLDNFGDMLTPIKFQYPTGNKKKTETNNV